MIILKKNKLFIISGHSGSGKTSLMRSLMSNELISFTTREKRKGEVNGVDYHFINDQHNTLVYRNKLIEKTFYGGNYYGLTKDEVDSKLKLGHAFAIVDCNGMQQLKKYYDNCVTIMLHTTKEHAMLQMLKRGDSAHSIESRLSTFNEELSNKQFYDYCVFNKHGKFEQTRFILNSILQVEMDKMEEF